MFSPFLSPDYMMARSFASDSFVMIPQVLEVEGVVGGRGRVKREDEIS